MTDDETANDDTERIERTDIGASIAANLKRGTGTRDQDEIRIKGKGEDAEEALEQFETLLERYEDDYADRLRDIDPDRDEGDDDE